MVKNAEKIGLIYMTKYIFTQCYTAKKSYFIYIHLLSVLHAVLFVAEVVVSQKFLDSVSNAVVGIGTKNMAFAMLLIYTLSYIMRNVVDNMADFAVETNMQRCTGYLKLQIAKKASEIEPIEFEKEERLDDINKASNGAKAAVMFQNTVSIITMFYLPYFLFMSAYLLHAQPMLLLAIFVVFIPKATVQIVRSTYFSKLEDRSAPLRREYEAYFDLFLKENSAKELRSLGAYFHIKQLMEDILKKLNKENKTAIWKANMIEALFDLLTIVGYCVVLFLLIYYFLTGNITIGMFAAIYSSVWTVFDMMDNMIKWRIGTLAECFGHIRNYIRFINIPIKERSSVEVDKCEEIVFKKVCFAYPNSTENVLKDIDLTIHAGQTIAIVGGNGAGKSTLVKILLGIYSPDSGRVMIGNKNISEVTYDKIFSNVSAVFQTYQRYKMTVEDNVRISDFESQEDTLASLEDSGAKIHNKSVFPKEKKTMMSRDFGGVDISGGEWQRLAIARGLYRKSDIIVLDEPTAAIDPIEEKRMYLHFKDIAKDKTAIIVTHRIASAQLADRIIVLKNGRIVQDGTHEELIKKEGEYSTLFLTQAKWYSTSQ